MVSPRVKSRLPTLNNSFREVCFDLDEFSTEFCGRELGRELFCAPRRLLVQREEKVHANKFTAKFTA